MVEIESKRDALIRVAQFIFRRESEIFSNDCQDSLVKTVLFNAENRGLSIPEIIDEIAKQMHLISFPQSIIKASLSRLCKKGEVYEELGKYFLNDKEYEKMRSIISKRKNLIIQFESKFTDKITEKLREKGEKIDASIINLAIEVLYEFLAIWFKNESDFVAKLLISTGDIQPIDLPLQILNNCLKKINDINLQNIIYESITETFEELESEKARFLYETFKNYLNLELLNLDPECRFLQKNAIARKTLILDTNILMALFLKGHRLHKATVKIISFSKELGIRLVFTKRTKQEWVQVLEKANERYGIIEKARPSLLASLDDIFIKSYFKEKSSNPHLNWHDFYLKMRHIEKLAKEKNIEFWFKKEIDPENLKNKKALEPLSGRVYYCAKTKGNIKSKDVSEHDAYHLLLVRQIRQEQPADLLGPSCWFLTHDASLLCADDWLNKFMKTPLEAPSSFVAEMWIPLISPFLGPEIPEDSLSETFAHLMKTHFAAIPSGIKADEVIEVVGPWLPYETLSNSDIEAILSDAVVVRYYEKLKEAGIRETPKFQEYKEKLREVVDNKVHEILDKKVKSAEKEMNLAIQQREELLWERKWLFRICACLGTILILLGIYQLFFEKIGSGFISIIFGIIFFGLLIAFRYIKFKFGPFEMEAKR